MIWICFVSFPCWFGSDSISPLDRCSRFLSRGLLSKGCAIPLRTTALRDVFFPDRKYRNKPCGLLPIVPFSVLPADDSQSTGFRKISQPPRDLHEPLFPPQVTRCTRDVVDH